MEPLNKAITSMRDLIAEQRRFLEDLHKLLGQIDARRRLERGEDGFDG